MEYKSVEDLLLLLQERGLQIKDRALACHYLETIGHHRLSAFYISLYDGPKCFDTAVPTTIDDVFHLYSFDRRLRLLLMGPLEKVEVALRALIIKEIGDHLTARAPGPVCIDLFDQSLYDLTSKTNRKLFSIAKKGCEKGAWKDWIRKAGRGGNGPNDPAFKAYFSQLPSWRVLQAASFTPLVHMLRTLRPEIARAITNRFGLAWNVLATDLYSLKELRNACAHHEPIWNWDARQRAVPMKFPKRFAAPAGVTAENDFRIYAYCALIHVLLSYLSNGGSTWHRRLKKLVNEFSTLYSRRMGFPEDWQTRPFWCVSTVSDMENYQRLRGRVSTAG